MVMHCLDTSVVVDFLRGNRHIIDKITKLVEEEKVFLTSITLCELFKGVYLSNKVEKELEIVENFIKSVGFLYHDSDSCKYFGEVFAKLHKNGKMTNEFDLMIASIVKVNNMVLVTMDKRHFENLGVKLEIW